MEIDGYKVDTRTPTTLPNPHKNLSEYRTRPTSLCSGRGVWAWYYSKPTWSSLIRQWCHTYSDPMQAELSSTHRVKPSLSALGDKEMRSGSCWLCHGSLSYPSRKSLPPSSRQSQSCKNSKFPLSALANLLTSVCWIKSASKLESAIRSTMKQAYILVYSESNGSLRFIELTHVCTRASIPSELESPHYCYSIMSMYFLLYSFNLALISNILLHWAPSLSRNFVAFLAYLCSCGTWEVWSLPVR